SAASRSLTDLCVADGGALDVLAELDDRPPVDGADADGLRPWKRLELLRIAARDLLGIDDLAAVGRALAALADDVLGGACGMAATDALAVIGMGKLGGRELNYASDVDVIFVGSGGDDDAARRVMEIARTWFRIDTGLRPEGRSGPLSR